VRRPGFKKIIHGIAIHFLRATGTPRLTIQVNQPRLCRIRVAFAARNHNRTGDKRQFVIFLQKDHDSILQLNAGWLVRLELVQRRYLDLLPRLGLLGK